MKSVTSTFDMVAEPTRRRMLDLLRTDPRTVTELVRILRCSQPGISKHLRVLREAGLVTVHPEGKHRVYVLQAKPLAEIDEWLAPFREFWASRFDALERHLDTTEEP
jgi:DNA-binding transcriptional ArsR family regulator